MATVRTAFVQERYEDSDEYRQVVEISDRLLDHLNEPTSQQLLATANAPGQSSVGVQASFGIFAADLGFVNEARGLFGAYENRAVRPDYYLPLKATTQSSSECDPSLFREM